jgi:hypothetical protein
MNKRSLLVAWVCLDCQTDLSINSTFMLVLFLSHVSHEVNSCLLLDEISIYFFDKEVFLFVYIIYKIFVIFVGETCLMKSTSSVLAGMT